MLKTIVKDFIEIHFSYSFIQNGVAESPYSRSSFLCKPGTDGGDRIPSMADLSTISHNSTMTSSRSTRSTRSNNRTIDRAPKMQF